MTMRTQGMSLVIAQPIPGVIEVRKQPFRRLFCRFSPQLGVWAQRGYKSLLQVRDLATEMSLAFASTEPAMRTALRQFAELVDRALQKVVLFSFYYVPVSCALLNPFLRRSDIREVHSGSSRFASGRYAIYVLWQPDGTIPWYVRNLLEALKEQEVNTIAVVNHALSPEQRSVLQDLCAEILVRGNKGSDFGAYKDAVLKLM